MFLAGKAEETPKKCKWVSYFLINFLFTFNPFRDLIKTVRSLTNDAQFSTFKQVLQQKHNIFDFFTGIGSITLILIRTLERR